MPAPERKGETFDWDAIEVVVDLQTGAVSVLVPGTKTEEGDAIEIETVTADDEFAPQE